MIFVKDFHFTNKSVLGTNFRIWLLILSYICTMLYDGCTICVHQVPGVNVWVGGQLVNIGRLTLNGWADFYTIENFRKGRNLHVKVLKEVQRVK